MKYSLAFFVAIWLSGCSIFGAPTELDETKTWQADRIYQEADAKMRDRDYDKAIKYFQKLESRYPHGKYAAQAQLETAYAYYKKSDPVSCTAAAERFIKLHPNHPNVDYAYYMRGLASFTERGVVDRLTSQEINDRDPKAMNASFLAFKELTTRYPESRYAKDSALRMTYLVNALAAHELHVARYYMKRQAYLAAVNRCKYVFENYPQSTGLEEALIIMISAYESLQMKDLKDDAMRVLKTNYPDSKMLDKNMTTDERVWWKFWDSL
ncbi:MAG: outer membrane protein assembly factor BamD [Methylophilaceae bacterium]|jgi:outer membrane protein assembly factor BamD